MVARENSGQYLSTITKSFLCKMVRFLLASLSAEQGVLKYILIPVLKCFVCKKINNYKMIHKSVTSLPNKPFDVTGQQ